LSVIKKYFLETFKAILIPQVFKATDRQSSSKVKSNNNDLQKYAQNEESIFDDG
jgi:hypothetical protein